LIITSGTILALLTISIYSRETSDDGAKAFMPAPWRRIDWKFGRAAAPIVFNYTGSERATTVPNDRVYDILVYGAQGGGR